MVAARPPGLFHLRRSGPVGPLGHHTGPLRGGKAGRPSLPSQDDGQGAALRLLHRGGLLPPHRPGGCTRTSPSGCWRRTTRRTSAPSPTSARDHLEALADLFLQVLELCQQAGLVKLGHVALDGTKVRANASKHKAMSYGRMKEKEEQLQAEVDELLRKAQEVDEEEDRRYGKDSRGDELPEETGLPGGTVAEDKGGPRRRWRPRPGRRRSRLSPRAAITPGCLMTRCSGTSPTPTPGSCPAREGRDFQQSYNCQAVVDSEHQVIVAARATDQPSDKGQAVSMIEETILSVGAVPKEVSADAGYYSAKEVEELYSLGVDPFVAPEKTRHGWVPPPTPRGRIPKGLSAKDRMRRKLRTKRGRGTLRPPDGDGGTGIRPDQAGPGLPAVPAAWSGEGEPGVAADLRRPQPAEAVPLRARDVRRDEEQRRHREQQGHVPDYGPWNFQATIHMCLSATGTHCCRRIIPADRRSQLVNPQTGC